MPAPELLIYLCYAIAAAALAVGVRDFVIYLMKKKRKK